MTKESILALIKEIKAEVNGGNFDRAGDLKLLQQKLQLLEAEAEQANDLSTWLKNAAGLAGRKLEVAIGALEDQMVESCEDLRNIYANGDLRNVLKHAAILALVERALDKDCKTNEQNQTEGRAKNDDSDKKAPNEALPPGKR